MTTTNTKADEPKMTEVTRGVCIYRLAEQWDWWCWESWSTTCDTQCIHFSSHSW